MRYTPTLKLSTRLVAFVTVIVISAMFILFIGGTLSFKRVGQEYLDHYLQGIVEVVDKEMEDPDAAYSMQRWMPKMLQASNIIEMQLSSPVGVVYRFKDTSSRIDEQLLYEKSFALERNSGYQIAFKALPPYLGYSYSLEALWSITLAVALVIFCLMRGVKWLKEQLYGSELLEERGRMILAGRVEEHAKGDEREWPYTASEALDMLIEELQDARQERSRFDTFIRSQTFLDQLTGTANRVLFDSKLESTLSESGAYGGVMLLRINDWDSLCEENGKKAADDFIVDVGEGLSNVLQRYPDVILSRYYDADFAIFIPHQGAKEVATIASNCLKQLEKITPPPPIDAEDWCHIGVSMYQEGERRGRILDEAETALKSAQLQRINTWSRFQKSANANLERGSVRWRTLFDQVLTPSKLQIYQQPCYLLTSHKELQLEHHELFARIDDPERGILKASRFNAAIESVGYETMLDKTVLISVIRHIKQSPQRKPLSVNLYVQPFADKSYFKWFRDELLQLPMDLRGMLTFEFSEARLVKHLDYMRPVIRMIAGIGCKVCVGQAGRSIVSTYYLKDLKVDFLKLHRSLIKQIDQRHENQLFVRSLIGACKGLKTQVIAVGVDSREEQDVLISLGVDGLQGRYLAAETPMLPEISPTPVTRRDTSSAKVQPGRRNRWRRK
ncbi:MULTISPECIES: RNase E specificity factor CsrD [unclassified Vibrio]|uniref:RNase E specificity factor CsrD n=1 Tax=unclassified Vibrio TaxID=2614977 RepID=UPI001361F17C|nr:MULTISPECIES: RNase E specificity factor CsrD [unclassified Vibrio]NAW57937.1 RNase E specificity factor CsrD [Vibrio sp. V36_P2S2PM302]NAX24214.1 RNase E specificity factor CsrD [Vibrio sp. V38_P2S17PM301]NAX32811.1 RNase E specificity factor CsrD [Vibrio sp. V37_P2S8PM304]